MQTRANAWGWEGVCAGKMEMVIYFIFLFILFVVGLSVIEEVLIRVVDGVSHFFRFLCELAFVKVGLSRYSYLHATC